MGTTRGEADEAEEPTDARRKAAEETAVRRKPASVNGTVWRNRIVGYADVAPAELVPNPRNWRLHGDAQSSALSGVLSEVGWVQDVLVNRTTGHVVDGHLRITLALRHKEPTVPVKYVELTEAEEAEVLATLDPLSAMAQADAKQLDVVLRGFESGDAAVQAMLAELAKEAGLYLKPVAEDPGAQIDKAAELQVKWGTCTGQLWIIPSQSVPGREHRLLCGDSTKGEDVARLMGVEKATTLVTSPPYWTGQPYDGKPGESGAVAFMRATAKAWASLISRRIQIQTGHTNSTCIGDGGPLRKILLDAAWATIWAEQGWLLRHRRAWAKGGAIPHSAPVADLIDESWELVLTFYRPGHNEGGQERIDEKWAIQGVWDDIPGERGDGSHPCPFPVEMALRMILLYSVESDVVADPFAGSGTTAVAAEQTGRLCYGMEIEPKYVAVALERLAGLGLAPRLAE